MRRLHSGENKRLELGHQNLCGKGARVMSVLNHKRKMRWHDKQERSTLSSPFKLHQDIAMV
jgi:hypothetical protein